MAQASPAGGAPVIEIWEPTFKMAPADDERFVSPAVQKLVAATVDERLRGVEWESGACKELAADLAEEVKAKVKALGLPRYKIVVQAVVGQVSGQGATVASRCLWDVKTDNSASYSYKNETLFCTVVVFGTYLE